MSAAASAIDRVRNIVLRTLDPDIGDIGDDEELLLSGLLDSMAVVSITSELETHFQLEIPAMDITIENFESIAAMANYLSAHTNA